MCNKVVLSLVNQAGWIMRTASILLPAILLQSSALAREIHVAKTGNDSNAGSKSAPYLTIGKAAAVAVAGDVIFIHDGTYREWVKPARGGSSDTLRITYRAFSGDNPVIKGSEQITTWVKENGNVWRADIPNTLFGADNPYILTIGTSNYTMSSGANLSAVYVTSGNSCHLGDVYLDGEVYLEKFARANVDAASKTWYTEQSGSTTKIWANFGGADPNTRLAEILVRECVFAPTAAYVNYITVDGLTLQQAASGWAENNVYQSALMKTASGHRWIIQNCLIKDAKCSGLSSAPHGWPSINNVGHHVVRNNTIERCGEAGISGMRGWASSVIEGNLIQNINTKREFGGHECGGIKFHLAVDLLIKNNIIRNVYYTSGNAPGIWVDWQNQGVRITGNVIYGIQASGAIFMEFNRGINLIDNNILIDQTLRHGSERTVCAHNLLVNAGNTSFYDSSRTVDYNYPHAFTAASQAATPVVKLGSQDYNNIMLVKGLIVGSSGYRADYNVYYNGAAKLSGYDANSIVDSAFNTAFTRTDLASGVTIRFNASSAPSAVGCPPITYDFIGAYTYPNGMQEGMEDPEGNHIDINKDMFGNTRSTVHPMAGPFEALQEGPNTFTLYAGRTPSVEWSASSQTSINESGTLTVTAKLSAPLSRPVTVPFSVSGSATTDADYTISASPITIASGSLTGTATVTIIDDSIHEWNGETVILTMGTPTNANLGAMTVHTATIRDDDNISSPVVDAGPTQTVAMGVSIPWTPAEITATAWYDASDSGTISQSGGYVSQWSDKSGNGKHVTQSTTTNMPRTGIQTIGSRNALLFDGNDALFRPSWSYTGTSNLMILTVMTMGSGSASSARIFGMQNDASDWNDAEGFVLERKGVTAAIEIYRNIAAATMQT